jgi:Uma2 family endonuclease
MGEAAKKQKERYFSTKAEYLINEEESSLRHEFFNGEVIAMAGASINHNYIVGNVLFGLKREASGCNVFANDLKLDIDSANSFFYPDLMAACEPLQLTEGRTDSIKNPTLIVEVLSPSTEKNDRGSKFRAYQKVPSLQEYVLVNQEAAIVEVYRRTNKVWTYQLYEGIESQIHLASTQSRLTLSEVYQNVEFPIVEPEEGEGKDAPQ